MIKAELVWLRECPACHMEHTKESIVSVADIEAIAAANQAFEQECEEWFEGHVERLIAAAEVEEPPDAQAPNYAKRLMQAVRGVTLH